MIDDPPIQRIERQELVFGGCDVSQKSTNSSTNYMTCRTTGTDLMESEKSATVITNNVSTSMSSHTLPVQLNNTNNTNRSAANGSPRSSAKHGYDALSTVRLTTDRDMSADGDNDSHQGTGLEPGLRLGQKCPDSASATESQKEKKRKILDDKD